MSNENWTWTVVELPDRGQHDAMPGPPWSSMNWAEASRIAIDLVDVGGTGYPPIQVNRLDDLHTTERLLAMRCQGVTRTLGTRPKAE